MARTRVLRIIARMNVGGPAVEITELMRGLEPDRIEQRLLTGFCGEDEADFIDTQAPDVEVTRISGLGRSIRPGDDLLSLRQLVREIRRFQPDVIHTHTAKAGLLGRSAARIARSHARVVHTHHGHLLHGYFGPRKTEAIVRAERSLSRITDTLVTVGNGVRDDLLAAGIGRPEQYRVIYSGVRLGALPDPLEARRNLGLPVDRPTVALIGRLTRIKRPDRFLEVVRHTIALQPTVHFLVAGWGDQGDDLARAVAQQDLPVRMLGWRDDLERVLAATDIVVLTSDNEGTPLSLVQAALAGIPAVASDVGSVNEVVQRDVTGYLTEPDSARIAQHLLRLLQDDPGRDVMGRAARTFALGRFSPDAFLDQHRRLYDQGA